LFGNSRVTALIKGFVLSEDKAPHFHAPFRSLQHVIDENFLPVGESNLVRRLFSNKKWWVSAFSLPVGSISGAPLAEKLLAPRLAGLSGTSIPRADSMGREAETIGERVGTTSWRENPENSKC
jgi:hypothetical protein